MPVLTLACTINGKTPCPSAPSFVIKSYYNDADGETKEYAIHNHGDNFANHTDNAHSALLVSHLFAVFSITRGCVIPNFSAAVFLDAEMVVKDNLTKAGVFPTHSQAPLPACFKASNTSNHADLAFFPLAMVASFDAQGLAAEANFKAAKPMVIYKEPVCFAVPTSATLAISRIDGNPLPDQQLDVWKAHEHFWYPPLIHKLLTCVTLNNMDLDASTVFEEEIVFVTAADDVLEFTSDDIFFDAEPCIPFNTHLFPYHDEDNIIQDVSQGST